MVWEGLVNTLRSIRVNDVIDMVIMAFVFYKIIEFLIQKGSGRVLFGVVILLAVVLLASRLELYVIKFIFGKTFELGVLALLIVFQPEIRNMLEKVGAIPNKVADAFQGKGHASELERAIEQVVKACESMSKYRKPSIQNQRARDRREALPRKEDAEDAGAKKEDAAPKKEKLFTGALIVFERNDKVDELPEGRLSASKGIRFEAETKDELLRTIFYDGSPLHDMAVVVNKEGKIRAASCLLPLARDPNDDQLTAEMGTRHRAGLGMSENSDAVVVIVSEENGNISVAADAKLHIVLSPAELKERLKKALLKESGDEKTAWPSRFGFLKGKQTHENTNDSL